MEINRKVALFYGIMLGDGCLSTYKPADRNLRNAIAITLNLRDDRPFLEHVILPILLKFTGRKIPIKIRKKDGGIGVNFHNDSLFYFLSALGFPIGKKGTSLKIPEIFYKKRLLRYICQGLFATDGSLVLTDNNGTFYPRVEICSISRPLMRQVSDYLNTSGLNCRFYKARRKKENISWNQKYRLQINGKTNLTAFVKLIGFINPKQKDRLLYYKMKVARAGFEPATSSL